MLLCRFIISNTYSATRASCMHFATGSPRFTTVVEEHLRSGNIIRSCRILSGNHEAKADLTQESGGSDSGMSPKEHLMAALGSCTAMTIRTVFENSKALTKKNTANYSNGWADAELSGIQVKVTEHGDHPHVPSKLIVEISLDGKLTDQQKSRLLAASERCPVKKMMSGNLAIESSLL